MKKVLITGNSGFLGHHLTKECQKRGWYVVGVDKRPIPPKHSKPDHFILTNVKDLGLRDFLGIDYIFHLAFTTNIPNSVRHPVRTTYDNIGMTIHLLQFAREAEVKKVFFASTASLYANNPIPWNEDMTPEPIEPYSWQKLSCEYAFKMFSKQYGLPTVIARFFQVFGEFQRDDTALAAFIRAKEEGRPITLTETTAQSTFKSARRDFIYAGDLAEAVCYIMESDYGNGEIFNVSSGKCNTMEEVANALNAQIKWIPRRPYEVEVHLGDITKIKSLKWKPKISVIEWLKSVRIQ